VADSVTISGVLCILQGLRSTSLDAFIYDVIETISFSFLFLIIVLIVTTIIHTGLPPMVKISATRAFKLPTEMNSNSQGEMNGWAYRLKNSST
jgi:hypothetical protein